MFNTPYNMYPYMNMPTTLSRGAIPISQMGGNLGINNMLAGSAMKASKPGFFKSLAGIKWGEVLTNTQKTLNVINQAIPVYYQIKPIYSNLKSFGKIMSAFNEPQTSNINNNQNSVTNNQQNTIEKKENSNQPTFFIN